jgi:hypothetical protein
MGMPVTERLGSVRAPAARALVLVAVSVVVAAVAAVLVLLGVDRAEIIATLLFVPVFAAGLLVGSPPGWIAAGAATVVYVALRSAELAEAGIGGFGVLALTRAAAYAVAAQMGVRAQALVAYLSEDDEWQDSPLLARGKALSQPGGSAQAAPGGAEPPSAWSSAYVEAPGHADGFGPGQREPQLAQVGTGSLDRAGAGRGPRQPGAGAASIFGPAAPGGGGSPEPGMARVGSNGGPQPPAVPSGPGPGWAQPPPGPPGPAGWGPPTTPSWPPDSPAEGAWEAGGWQARGDAGDPMDGGPTEAGSEQPAALHDGGGAAPGWPSDEGGAAPGWPSDGGGAAPGWPPDGGGAAPGWPPEPSPRSGAAAPGWPEPPAWPDPPAGARIDLPPPPPARAPEPVDAETRLWTARFLCDRIAAAKAECERSGRPFSLVLVQVPDEPFAVLPYRRQITLLRELGHQFVAGGVIDHLVHVPDQTQHWFAVVLSDIDHTSAQVLERRLRIGIGGYLRSRGLPLGELESASLTAPDDDPAMGSIWEALISRAGPSADAELAHGAHDY